jgi:serine/threonine-protein kinase
MGEVYRARDAKLERDIALKILPPELSNNAEALRRFEQEARAASALNHPNIVTIYDIGQSDDVAWIAMELIEGDDLRTIVEREPLSLRDALRIAVKIVDGLAAAHDRAIVHRDLKPDNVMVTRDGFVKLLDFGLAKQYRIIGADDATVPHTSPGAVFGTVGYMSPEQAMGREMDYRSDQFSFGTLLYELLTRRRPFERGSKPETMAAIIRDNPEPPSELSDAVPHALDRIVARCLAKDPRQRYASTRDLAHDLREVRDELTHSSRPSQRSARVSVSPKRRRTRWLAPAIVVMVLALAGVALWMLMHRRAPQGGHVQSVAVLPFRDLTASSDGRVLADGISDMVASRLAAARGLRVAGPFDGAPLADGDDPRTIAQRRGVDAVVRGSVQRGGDSVRVTYALVDGRSGATLATSDATRAATDLFALEDAVADAVLRALGRSATPRAQTAAAALAPDDQKVFVEATGLLQRVGDEQAVDQAIAKLQSLLGNARDSAAVNALLARALMYKANLARRPALYEQAMVYAARGVALGPNDPDAQATLGRLQNQAGRYDDALRSFQRALSLEPSNASAMSGLAQAYDGLGRGGEAESMYRKVIALHPDDTGAMMAYGAFCFAHGRYADAAAHYRRVTELAPKNARAFASLGGALQYSGSYDEAQRAYQHSIALRPTATALTNLGALQFSLGRYDASRASFERAALLAPSEPVIWLNLGDACRAANNAGGAREAYARAADAARDALGVRANDAELRSLLALSLARGGKLTESQEEIRRALESDPTQSLVLYRAAVIAMLRGNRDSAQSWLERAIGAGYPRREAERDPDLAPLRDSAPFRNAVKSPS